MFKHPPPNQSTIGVVDMTKKHCTKCKELKPLTDYCPDKRSKDGVVAQCRKCMNIAGVIYKRSIPGLANKTWEKQKRTSAHRKHPAPNYTHTQLHQWLISQHNFYSLYNEWVSSGYITSLRPSCDRLDDYKPYTLDNLRLVTHEENVCRVHKDMMNGINNKQSLAVDQLTKSGDFIKTFFSIAEAGRRLSLNPTHICSCCNNDRASTGGYGFRYSIFIKHL